MKGGKSTMEIAELVSTGLTTLIADATGILTTATPAIIGVMGVFAGVDIGLKVFKKFYKKIG